jgi:hypothetical protein
LIAEADGAFKGEQIRSAPKAKYSEALALKPQEKYPKDQLAAIDKKLAELAKKAEEDAKQKAINEKYQAAIAVADAAFNAKTWDEAKAKYNDALDIKPAEKYPKDQLAAIDLAIAGRGQVRRAGTPAPRAQRALCQADRSRGPAVRCGDLRGSARQVRRCVDLEARGGPIPRTRSRRST